MEKIGTIDIAFREHAQGIYYYDVRVAIADKTRTIVLPRYHTFLGWIEVFGLPPQNEWVVLDDFPAFEKTARLQVDEATYEETVRYTPGPTSHQIETIRQNAAMTERCLWTQQYANAPTDIANEIRFEHPDGQYLAHWNTAVLEDTAKLPTADTPFAAGVVDAHGKPDVIIHKTVTAGGKLPPVYYSMFPIQELVELTETSGTVTELGYLETGSPHRIDQVHGAWYKRFTFGDTVLQIVESNYTSCDGETKNGPERIKDTYRKELYRE